LKFRTELELPNTNQNLDLLGGMIFMGSCFSDNIGQKMLDLGVPTLTNPFGVIFHPEPLLKILSQAIDSEFSYSESDLLKYDETSYSLKHHGSFKDDNAEKLLTRLNVQLDLLRDSLKKSSTLFITLGTAWGYSFKGLVVANCHKLPSELFSKSLSTHSQLAELLNHFLRVLSEECPQLKVIFTVSPVRHIRNGIVKDSRSKAILLSAAHEAIDANSNSFYFPSYELMMDDLRDYRFYESDLIHPNQMAIDYIFHYFSKALFSPVNNELLSELSRLLKLKKHKIKDPSSTQAIEFKAKIQRVEKELQRRKPDLFRNT